MDELFVHYKGGRYRKLWDAFAHPTRYHDSDLRLSVAFHSDDRHPLMVYVSQGLFIHVFDPFVDTGYDAVVYMSLTYGKIWVRRKEEFYEEVPNLAPWASEHFEGFTRRRFHPVEKFQ